MAETKRRARGEDSIFYDRSRNRWAGTITVGWKPDGRRDRIIVRGKTKTEVKDKLRTKHQELAAGIRAPARYTVEQCLNDWLETLSTQAESTVTGYRIMVRHLVELLGSVKLVELKVRDVARTGSHQRHARAAGVISPHHAHHGLRVPGAGAVQQGGVHETRRACRPSGHPTILHRSTTPTI